MTESYSIEELVAITAATVEAMTYKMNNVPDVIAVAKREVARITGLTEDEIEVGVVDGHILDIALHPKVRLPEPSEMCVCGNRYDDNGNECSLAGCQDET